MNVQHHILFGYIFAVAVPLDTNNNNNKKKKKKKKKTREFMFAVISMFWA